MRTPSAYMTRLHRGGDRLLLGVVIGLLAICGAMATAANAPELVVLAKHAIRIG